MLFNRTYNLKSSKDVSSIKNNLIGKHFQIHKIDFEVIDHNGKIRAVPHAEALEGERILTLPVTRIDISANGNNSNVKVASHPRRTDIGGPLLLLIVCIVFFVVGTALVYKGGPDVHNSALLMMAISFIVALIFWIKMELGYFDYVRKVKNFIKENIK